MPDLPKKCYIVNKDTTPDGKSLAVTHLGSDTALTVTEFKRVPTQAFIISDRNNKDQAIIPLTDQDGSIQPYNHDTLMINGQADKWVWCITESEGTYVIEDWNHYVFWDIWDLKEKEQVLTHTGPAAKNQYWKLIEAD